MSFIKFTRAGMLAIILIVGVLSGIAAIGNIGSKQRAKARYYYLKGAVSEAEGNMDKAYEFYKKAYQADPEYTDASFAHGFSRSALNEDTFTSLHELRRDLKLMKKFIDENPLDIEAVQRYGYIAANADTIPEALRVYNIIAKANPGLSQLYYPMSYYHMSLGNMDSAVYAIREFERLEGATFETVVRKVYYWVTKGDTLAALKEADAYVDNSPGNPQALIDKANIYNMLERPDAAIEILEGALKDYPEKSEMKFDIALIYAEKGDTTRFHKLVEEAMKGETLEYEDRMEMLVAYTRALSKASSFRESDVVYKYLESLYPQDADYFDLYTDYELIKGDYQEAFKKEKKAFALNPDEPSFLGRLLSLSMLAGKPSEGMRAFEGYKNEEYKRQPTMILGYVMASDGANEQTKGLQWLDTLIRQYSPDLRLSSRLTSIEADSLIKVLGEKRMKGLSMAYEMGGELYAKLKCTDDAVRSYENAILTDSTNASALNNFAYYVVETFKALPGSDLFERAKEMSRKSIDLTSENPQSNYMDTYAWILFKEGNYKDALEYQEVALELEGETQISEFMEHYGDILYMNGRTEDAVEQWERALKLNPEDKTLKKKIKENKIDID